MKAITKEECKNDLDNFLVQKVEGISFIDNNLELKLVDREKLIFRNIKIVFADLRIFSLDNLYFYDIKIKKLKETISLTLIFEKAGKLYDLKLNML